LIIVLLGSLFIFSCGTPQRAVYNYLEDVRDTSFKKNVYIAESVIQKNDLLSIQVYSASLDPSVDALYNATAGAGYLVDVKGNIEMPRIGTIHAEGLMKSELEDIIKEKLKGQLNQPSVLVRFQNFRITVLGEVRGPGVLNIPTERLTILEAVGMAGGITEYGKIKEVKILRENNGVRQLGTLDLTSQNIFQSPYYQLQQNDVILVDQNRYKLRQTEQTRISQQIGFALSIITSIALLYNIFR
ncbi:MAG: polysaccharide biosynthesis/export family protein, partial [Flavisolibacter sp.]|nr:polysaccharide biosynthesis/export family protein [Flavisolibacter sp.]